MRIRPADVLIVSTEADRSRREALRVALAGRKLRAAAIAEGRADAPFGEAVPGRIEAARAVVVIIGRSWPMIDTQPADWMGPAEVAAWLAPVLALASPPALIVVWVDGAGRAQTPPALRRVVGVPVEGAAFGDAAAAIEGVLGEGAPSDGWVGAAPEPARAPPGASVAVPVVGGLMLLAAGVGLVMGADAYAAAWVRVLAAGALVMVVAVLARAERWSTARAAAMTVVVLTAAGLVLDGARVWPGDGALRGATTDDGHDREARPPRVAAPPRADEDEAPFVWGAGWDDEARVAGAAEVAEVEETSRAAATAGTYETPTERPGGDDDAWAGAGWDDGTWRGGAPTRAGRPAPEPEFVRVPAGAYMMGKPPPEPPVPGASSLWDPPRRVRLTRAQWVKVTEVTQREFRAVMGELPRVLLRCETCPVADVTWYDAAIYANTRSAAEGLSTCYALEGCTRRTWGSGLSTCTSARGRLDCDGYRLPTEAEWEYFARAGTTTVFWWGDDYRSPTAAELREHAGHLGRFDSRGRRVPGPLSWNRAHPVALGPANPWGLYDVHANVGEWCHDGPEHDAAAVVDPVGRGSQRVFRGGGFYYGLYSHRAADRRWTTPDRGGSALGFRVVRRADGT